MQFSEVLFCLEFSKQNSMLNLVPNIFGNSEIRLRDKNKINI